MLEQFYKDLEKAKGAEQLVRNVLAALTNDYTFTAIGDIKEYYYKGDIKAVDKSGNELFIEVKDDGRIHETKNILCEEEVYFKECDYYSKGNMKSDYDIYSIVSKEERKIYIFDFKKLKEIYKAGYYKEIEHPT